MADELFKVIFKLEGDNTSILKSLDEVNAKYKEQSFELNRQMTALKTLQTNEAALLKGRAASQNPTAVANYNRKIEETRKKIQDVQKAVENLTITDQKSGKAAEDLGKKMAVAFDATKINAATQEVKKLNDKIAAAEKPITSIHGQLRLLKEQLANTDDDKEFLRLSIEAGKLEDKINDAREAAQIFATDSPFQSVGRGIRGVVSDLASLDFQGAAQKSKLLVDATKQITFKSSIAGLKDIGVTLANLGKSLLMNPIFLIGAAVTAIISNFDDLKKSGGLIGGFFTGIGKLIDDVKSGFLRLTDAIGLTHTALDDYNESVKNDFEANTKKQIDDIDRLISKYQALGKETRELEIQRQRIAIRNAERELFPLEKGLESIAAAGGVPTEEVKKKVGDLRKIITDGNAEIELINIKANKTAADKQRKLDDDARAARDKAIDDEIKARQKQREFEAGGDADLARILAEEKEKAQKKELEDKQNFEQTKQEIDLINSAKSVDLARTEAEEKEKIEAAANEKRKQRIQAEVQAIQTLVASTIQATNQIINAKIHEIDKLSALQSKRVADAKEIADKGNAELYELEQKRLDDLNQQRELFVKRQQALATIELIANTAIAVSKAAAQGGVAAAITIAAALIALTGGLIQARSIASQAAYYEGGYTGDGNPREASRAVGPRPYTYHKGEFVMNHEKTGKYRDIFQGIHEGQIDLNDWRKKVNAFEAMKLMPQGGSTIDVEKLVKEISALRTVVEGQSTSVSLDENGLELRFKKIKSRNSFIKNNLGRA